MERPIFYYLFLQLISRAFQNTLIKLVFIKYFSSYEAWNTREKKSI